VDQIDTSSIVQTTRNCIMAPTATTDRRTTVVGVFEDRTHAAAAVKDLYQAGFNEQQIGIARRRADDDLTETVSPDDARTSAGTDAVAGAIAGAGVGGLVGLGVVSGVIPALGPVIAGGTLAAILANAAGGAAIGGVLGALTGSDVPHEDANYYQGEFEAGRTIVTVSAGGRYDEAASILRRHGACDMNQRDSRPTVMMATSEATPRNTTITGATTAPYPQTPGETSALSGRNTSVQDR
jgi:hypothetical protein